jgi:predicted negative regulator of RcsB-dependent stress response
MGAKSVFIPLFSIYYIKFNFKSLEMIFMKKKRGLAKKGIILLFIFLVSALAFGCSQERTTHQPETMKDEKSFYKELFSAINKEDKQAVSNALKEDIEPNYEMPEYGTLLTAATKAGDPEIIKQIIEKGADVNKADESGQTPLHWGSQKGKTDAVKVLIDAKADINAKNDNGETPLALAKSNNFPEIEKLLKDAGAKE